MKKIFFTLSVLALSAIGVLAQGVSGGLKAGVNFANQKYDFSGVTLSPDSRTGFHVGGFLNIGFSESFSLQPELLYNSVGAKLQDTEFKADYFSVPIMIKYNPVAIFNIHAGPQFGILLSAKEDGDDVKDTMKGADLGIGFGAGLDLPMGLGLSARYVLGLSNIADDEDIEADGKVTNTAFQVSLTYRLFGGD